MAPYPDCDEEHEAQLVQLAGVTEELARALQAMQAREGELKSVNNN